MRSLLVFFWMLQLRCELGLCSFLKALLGKIPIPAHLGGDERDSACYVPVLSGSDLLGLSERNLPQFFAMCVVSQGKEQDGSLFNSMRMWKSMSKKEITVLF